MVEATKRCSHCKETKPISAFGVDNSRRDCLKVHCRICASKFTRTSLGCIDYDKNISCTNYLGIHIAETKLLDYFKTATRMPMNNPGYDFICGKGFKVDVKSAILFHYAPRSSHYWSFDIRWNKETDYFFCLAYDNRTDLNLQHTWLIPAEIINDKYSLVISYGSKSLAKWKEYELPVKECTNVTTS